jgi:uncharacterized protein (DUF1684 family)
LVLALAPACSSAPDDDASYLKEIEQFRAEREQFMRSDPESPIPPDKKNVLLPLKYFAADPSFVVPAVLRVADERPVFEMPTSTGTIRRNVRVGVLEFTIPGQAMTLGAFVEEGTKQISTLFVPFADQTTGKETYPAGRYLDLHPTATNIYTIDFNRAYNPYCAYNNSYECPFPPPSNRLKIAVNAGEKLPGA